MLLVHACSTRPSVYARKFKAYFDSVGVTCELYGSTASGLPALPQGVSIEQQVMQLFSDQWQSSGVKPNLNMREMKEALRMANEASEPSVVSAPQVQR
jgi:hypothetical protein